MCWRFWSKIDAKQEISRIFKDSLWLEQVTDLDAKGTKLSIIWWATNVIFIFLQIILFIGNCRSPNICSLHTYGVRQMYFFVTQCIYRFYIVYFHYIGIILYLVIKRSSTLFTIGLGYHDHGLMPSQNTAGICIQRGHSSQGGVPPAPIGQTGQKGGRGGCRGHAPGWCWSSPNGGTGKPHETPNTCWGVKTPMDTPLFVELKLQDEFFVVSIFQIDLLFDFSQFRLRDIQ